MRWVEVTAVKSFTAYLSDFMQLMGILNQNFEQFGGRKREFNEDDRSF